MLLRHSNKRHDIEIHEHRFVIKRYKEYTFQYQLYERELYWLDKLNGTGISPAVLSHGDSAIKMQYVGERLSKLNMPGDYKRQCEDILKILELNECSHNDIKPSELLNNNGKICLVDFEWATRIGEPIPEEWPKALGQGFHVDIHTFDNRFSLEKSILHILRGE